MIIGGFNENLPNWVGGSVLIGTSLAGQGLAVMFTAGLPKEKDPAASGLALLPMVTANGYGVQVSLSY